MSKLESTRKRPRLIPVETLETRSLMTIAATAPLPDVGAAPGAAATTVNLDSYFKDPAAAPDFAIFDTTLGTIPVLLTPSTTPATVANFESYVAKGAYTNSIVHRSVPGFIWQAGGYQLTASQQIQATPESAPVKNEFGASNLRGTIAMAKLGSDPNSATNEFFFNESNSNAANLDNQNGGFTVFGHVVGDAGLAVMDAVASVPVPSPGPLASPLDSAPLQNYKAGAAFQPSNLILIKDVTTTSELFLTVSDAPGIATASVSGNSLTITPVAAGTAHVTVIAYGSDGKTATESFAVNVGASSTPVTNPPTSPPVVTPPVTVAPNPQPPVSTPTPQPPVIIQPIATPPLPSSVLLPSVRGSLPASAVAGGKVKIQQSVSLLNPSGNLAQAERVTLGLAATGSGSGALTIAATTTSVKLKTGKSARVTLSTRQLSASIPVGSYHVIVTVTDPGGAQTTVYTGHTLVVLAPKAKPVKG